MPFHKYLKAGRLKTQKTNKKQIEIQICRAVKDLKTAHAILNVDPEWAGTIAYHAMLRAGRALIFAHGFLPADGAQHVTVVELTGALLGEDYSILVAKFEKLRRGRNLFFYDSGHWGSTTDARNAIQAADHLVAGIASVIKKVIDKS